MAECVLWTETQAGITKPGPAVRPGVVMDLKSGLGPLWLIYFISLFFFFLSRDGVCVGGGGSWSSKVTADGWDGRRWGRGLSFLRASSLGSPNPLATLPALALLFLGRPLVLPGRWRSRVRMHTERDVPVTCCVSPPQDKAQWAEKCLRGA